MTAPRRGGHCFHFWAKKSIAPRDPEAVSTWDTIGGTIDVDEITDEEELEDLRVEPTAGDLGILADTDVPGRPG